MSSRALLSVIIALLVVLPGGLARRPARARKPARGNVALYFKAVAYEWDFVPPRNPVTGALTDRINHCVGAGALLDSPDEEWSTWTTAQLGPKLMKAKYVACPAPSNVSNPATWINCESAVRQEFVANQPTADAHLGIMGPLIRAAPGDTITITLLNALSTVDPTLNGIQSADMPTFPINIQPSGLSYDGNSAVAPGGIQKYVWTVPPGAAPADDEPDTKLWMYHSTINPFQTDNLGLYGAILVSRNKMPATPQNSGNPDVVSFLQIVDEVASPFYSYNVAKYGSGLGENEVSAEGLLKHTINGFLYCSVPFPWLKQNIGVRWHNGVVGSSNDIHTMHWHANTHLLRGRRGDVLQMTPGSAYSVNMETRANGIWLLHCHVDDHIFAGMLGLYNVVGDEKSRPTTTGGVKRHFWIAAELDLWDYAPGDALLNKNLCVNSTADANQLTQTQYFKARYVEYMPGSWSVPKPREEYLGLMGPLIKAEVGDLIVVHFKNNLPACNDPAYPFVENYCHPSLSMHPHGVAYGKASEGAPYDDGSPATADDAVPPGQAVTYRWGVPASSGPGPSDPATVSWYYHSHTDEIGQPYAGLNGLIIIGRQGAFVRGPAGELLAPVGVDRDIALMYSIYNEQTSYLWDFNSAYLANVVGMSDEEISDSELHTKYSINGRIYCNNPELQLTYGSKVRAHLLSVGTETDIHAPTMPGSVFTRISQSALSSSSIAMIAGSMTVADIDVSTPIGSSTLQCGVQGHTRNGEKFRVSIGVSLTTPPTYGKIKTKYTAGRKRTYFIAADQVLWDFGNAADASLLNKCPPNIAPFVPITSPYTIKTSYHKAQYRLYPNRLFNPAAVIKTPPAHGILGPLLSAEVDDILEIVFKNNLPFDVNFNLEGARFFTAISVDGSTSFDYGAPVQPGIIVTYTYLVQKSAAPYVQDRTTIGYSYGSSIDPIAHTNAGLIGVLNIGAKGTFPTHNPKVAAVPVGVASIFPLVSHVFEETESAFAEINGLAGVDDDDAEMHRKYSINGKLFCNLEGMIVKKGTTMRAVFMSYGSQSDMHSMSIAGHVLTKASHSSATADLLLPSITTTVDVIPTVAGRFLLSDNVHAHYDAGEQAAISVIP